MDLIKGNRVTHDSISGANEKSTYMNPNHDAFPREEKNSADETIEIANDETDREHLITTSPILKSNENKNIEAILDAY
ncbi:unnamed protein product [Rotaria sp. Silwood1]|nr:unnamed protein product [Rotaria sp. Silwood1]